MLDSIIKSTAVPVAFPLKDGCIDGGCVRNYPIVDALGQQVDEIILVVTATIEPKPIGNIFDIIGQFISIVLYNQLTEAKKLLELVYIQNPNMRLAKLIVIQPDKPTNIGLLNIDKIGNREQRQAFIDSGYNLAMEILTANGYKKKES
jgi:predicted acylesterase/phospholipase RssA